MVRQQPTGNPEAIHMSESPNRTLAFKPAENGNSSTEAGYSCAAENIAV